MTVTTPGGTSATSAADEFTYGAGPTVTGVSPTSGPDRPAAPSVTVTGTNLSGATSVDFGTVRRHRDRRLGHLDHRHLARRHRRDRRRDRHDPQRHLGAPLRPTSSPTWPPRPSRPSARPSGPTAGGTTVTVTGTNLSRRHLGRLRHRRRHRDRRLGHLDHRHVAGRHGPEPST